jgi:hypothetical protein
VIVASPRFVALLQRTRSQGTRALGPLACWSIRKPRCRRHGRDLTIGIVSHETSGCTARWASTCFEIDDFIHNKNAQEAATAPGLPGPDQSPPEGATGGLPEPNPSPTGGEPGARWFHVKKQFHVALAGVGLPGYVT